jgi:hypothetical protein
VWIGVLSRVWLLRGRDDCELRSRGAGDDRGLPDFEATARVVARTRKYENSGVDGSGGGVVTGVGAPRAELVAGGGLLDRAVEAGGTHVSGRRNRRSARGEQIAKDCETVPKKLTILGTVISGSIERKFI